MNIINAENARELQRNANTYMLNAIMEEIYALIKASANRGQNSAIYKIGSNVHFSKHTPTLIVSMLTDNMGYEVTPQYYVREDGTENEDLMIRITIKW